jgi:threonine dehydratase
MNWKHEIEQAAARIESYVVRTPTATSNSLGLAFPVELKFEQMQHTGSFKARGAFNTLLSEGAPKAGIVAASGGNHGAAVAFAAKTLGHNARIYVPEVAGPAKISLIQKMGADLQVVPGKYADAMIQAQAWEAKTGARQVHAYDTVATVAGQGTLAYEWQDQGLHADTIFIAVGGGGLIAGAAAWFGGNEKIIAVEPATSCALHSALEQGAPVNVEVSGVAVNALGAQRVGQICYDLAVETGMQSVLVSDDAIVQAQHLLWSTHRQLVEPSGAAALAALTSGAYVPEPGEKVAVLVCGANIAPDPLN